MLRRNFLKLLGVSAIALPLAKLLPEKANPVFTPIVEPFPEQAKEALTAWGNKKIDDLVFATPPPGEKAEYFKAKNYWQEQLFQETLRDSYFQKFLGSDK